MIHAVTETVTDAALDAVRDNPEAGRFELTAAGETAFARYRREPGTLVVTYVYAPSALRGTGIAGALMEGVAARARAEGARILPLCGYARGWLRASRAHRDLIA